MERSNRALGDAEVRHKARGHLDMDVEHAVASIVMVTADSLILEGLLFYKRG